MQVQAKVPALLLEQWQAGDSGLAIVLEDLRSPCSLQHPITRLTHQALGLNFPQVWAS